MYDGRKSLTPSCQSDGHFRAKYIYTVTKLPTSRGCILLILQHFSAELGSFTNLRCPFQLWK